MRRAASTCVFRPNYESEELDGTLRRLEPRLRGVASARARHLDRDELWESYATVLRPTADKADCVDASLIAVECKSILLALTVAACCGRPWVSSLG